jgi:hypothetical protein
VHAVLPRFLFALVALQSWSAADADQPRPASPADSAQVHRSARSAQQSFESFRRSRLPIGYGHSGPCDVQIGRYCYWRLDESDDPAPPENAAIAERRGALIRLLDSASNVQAGDAWIAGQLVRYLVEASRADDAIRFANERCRAEASWCHALAGYAAHVAERFAAADSAFARALDAMPADERCRWLDISELLDDDLERRFRQVDCAGREALARQLFWIGAPMYSVSSTDLLTEHFARLTRIRLSARAATTNGSTWADDERQLTLRYGWPRWYSRSTAQSGMSERLSITGHDAGMPYNFFPSARAIDSLAAVAGEDWTLANPRARTGYAPSYAKTLHDIPGQIALFRRGDTTLAVAAWDARRDTTLLGRSIDAALVLASHSAIAIARSSEQKATGRIFVSGVVDSGVVSLELLAKADKRAARIRLGVPLRSPGRVALSDLLLYAADTTPAYELSVVRDSALASSTLSAPRAVGVYWEAYGLRVGADPVKYSLTFEQIDVSWMQRVAEHLRFADPTSALRVQWSEMPEHRNGIAGRGVRVDLSRLRAGRYRIELRIATENGDVAVTTRNVEIR